MTEKEYEDAIVTELLKCDAVSQLKETFNSEDVYQILTEQIQLAYYAYCSIHFVADDTFKQQRCCVLIPTMIHAKWQFLCEVFHLLTIANIISIRQNLKDSIQYEVLKYLEKNM